MPTTDKSPHPLFIHIAFTSGIEDKNFPLRDCFKKKIWCFNIETFQGEEATSETAWFETAKMEEEWHGQWMASSLDKEIQPFIRNTFTLPEDIVSARAYVCGLGIYELMINGQRMGDEYFTPGYNAYDFWLQYQTYDITSQLKSGENSIGLSLGNGWYKGRLGLKGDTMNCMADNLLLLRRLLLQEWMGQPS
jgi:hypothetical protein